MSACYYISLLSFFFFHLFIRRHSLRRSLSICNSLFTWFYTINYILIKLFLCFFFRVCFVFFSIQCPFLPIIVDVQSLSISVTKIRFLSILVLCISVVSNLLRKWRRKQKFVCRPLYFWDRIEIHVTWNSIPTFQTFRNRFAIFIVNDLHEMPHD